MKRSLAFVALLAVFTASACTAAPAGTAYTSPLGYTITLPQGWKMLTETGAESFFTRAGGEDSTGASVGLRDASADLYGERVVKMIDLSDVKVTKDAKSKHFGMPARVIVANASSEGDKLLVRAIAIKPSVSSKVFMFQVWGKPEAMKDSAMKAEIKVMFDSFKPSK